MRQTGKPIRGSFISEAIQPGPAGVAGLTVQYARCASAFSFIGRQAPREWYCIEP